MAVGSPFDDGGVGVVEIHFLTSTGESDDVQSIGDGVGGFGGDLSTGDGFGSAVASVGDLDGDGVADLAVGTPGYDGVGAVWILFLDVDGTVSSYLELSSATVPFASGLGAGDELGASLAAGDIDGDGIKELLVGAPGDDDGATDAGAVWSLLLYGPKSESSDPEPGSVRGYTKISATAGHFQGSLSAGDRFGASVAIIGDLSGESPRDIVAGAPGDDASGTDRGAAWVLFLASNGTVESEVRIEHPEGSGAASVAQFGWSIAALGDVNGDTYPDIAVGAPGHREWGCDRGGLWVLALEPDGSVVDQLEISAAQGGFAGILAEDVRFGAAVAQLGDLDGDGMKDLAIGAPGTSGGDLGTAWVLFQGPFEAAVVRYGSGVNPVDSLSVVSGEPRIGSSITLAVNNPYDTQPSGSLPYLRVTSAPTSPFPAGTLTEDLGMSYAGADGELLVPMSGTLIWGDPWSGSGSPEPIVVAIPNDTDLIGVSLFVQGFLYDPGAGSGDIALGATDAVRLHVGPTAP